LIDKHDYAGAEPLLRKVVGDDPANYVAWYELGFVENGLGKTDDSIHGVSQIGGGEGGCF
jgi:Tfp pilus assembly protein PilF